MRNAVLLFAALAALAFSVGGLSEKWRLAPQKAGIPAVEVAAQPALSGSTQPAAAAVALAAVPAPVTPPDPDADLPAVQVVEPPVHAVPADAAVETAPAVTFRAPAPPVASSRARDGSKVERTASASPPPAPPRPRAAARPAAVAPPAPPIGGRARPAADASLSIDGRAVRLFGVRPADARDRCGEDGASCGEAARAALAQRLAGNPGVTCALPPGQDGEPGYICHDSRGVDLGRLLVIEGLALADTTHSYQYLTAQDGARVAHQGLWRYR